MENSDDVNDLSRSKENQGHCEFDSSPEEKQRRSGNVNVEKDAMEVEKEKEDVKLPCTPAIQRLRNTMNTFQVHSPSDALVSPCSQRLRQTSRYRQGQNRKKQAAINVKKTTRVVDFDAADDVHDPEKQSTSGVNSGRTGAEKSNQQKPLN